MNAKRNSGICAHPESLENAGIPGHSWLFQNYKYLILTPSPSPTLSHPQDRYFILRDADNSFSFQIFRLKVFIVNLIIFCKEGEGEGVGVVRHCY